MMRVLKSLSAVTTYPTGNKSFAVQQGFPQPISAEEADPFLMCDHFVLAPTLHLSYAAFVTLLAHLMLICLPAWTIEGHGNDFCRRG